jgi:ABC-type multidrug transport system fused ATPase/permease subunit
MKFTNVLLTCVEHTGLLEFQRRHRISECTYWLAIYFLIAVLVGMSSSLAGLAVFCFARYHPFKELGYVAMTSLQFASGWQWVTFAQLTVAVVNHSFTTDSLSFALVTGSSFIMSKSRPIALLLNGRMVRFTFAWMLHWLPWTYLRNWLPWFPFAKIWYEAISMAVHRATPFTHLPWYQASIVHFTGKGYGLESPNQTFYWMIFSPFGYILLCMYLNNPQKRFTNVLALFKNACKQRNNREKNSETSYELKVHQLSFAYQSMGVFNGGIAHVLKNVSFCIEARQVLGIFGKNGSGMCFTPTSNSLSSS